MGRRLVLILGGSAEAAALAACLDVSDSWHPLTSLAGRTRQPGTIAGAIRTGGFGGAAGLAAWLGQHRPAAVVDATHPFARQMPHHAAQACRAAAVPRLRLVRPSWQRQAEDRWSEVADVAEAVRVLPAFGKTAFLSTGQEGLEQFLALAGRMRLVVRTIEPVAGLPPGVLAIQARPPFTLKDEIGLLRRYGVDALVTKASGGAATEAKILAARALSLPVVMLARPPLPDGPLVHDVAGALAWLAGLRA